MKLKKIVSLAAAALMAVSMLSACGEGTGSNSSSSEAPVVNVNNAVSKVIAQLDSKTTDKVSFTADPAMQKALEDLIKQNGNGTSSITNTNLVTMNPKLGSTSEIPALDNVAAADTNDGKAYTYLYVVGTTSAVGDDYAFVQLANALENEDLMAAANDQIVADLPDHGNELTSAKSYYYDFDYTGKMAVAAVKDAATGSVHYYAAVAITRTPTKHSK